MHLVLIETSGNQAYIFATNKLGENVGASDLTHRAGMRFTLEAVREAGGPGLWAADPVELRRALLDERRNPPLTEGQGCVEVILAVSGKALLLTRDEATARRVVTYVTRRTLEEAPGLDVCGVVSGSFDLAQHPLHERIGEVHRKLTAVRSRLPGPSQRFLRLPVVAECASSGLPAARFDDSRPRAEWAPRSRVSLAKQDAAEEGFRRIRHLAESHPLDHRLPLSTKHLEDLGCDWLAVVHADGNDLGQIFLSFHEHLGLSEVETAARNRTYVDTLRHFSLALDACTERAFCKALTVLRPRGPHDLLPVVPLVLGGDDLTVVCDGRRALPFTCAFLRAFEDETGADKDVGPVVRGALARDSLKSGAGVAVIKPHFPFFAAYELAEELKSSAKTQKPHSAVDYHVVHDASGTNLDRIRGELERDYGQTQLVARPYVVTPNQGPPGRRLVDLKRRVEAIPARDEKGRRRLPNSMLHDLREGLFLGRDPAEARLALVRDRYSAIDSLLADGALFWKDGEVYRTGLLDAMELAEFWGQEP